jgi:Ca-activated chloride channel family protein
MLAPWTVPAPSAQFVSGVRLVEVYATVTDATGQPVTGLTAADFTVTDDGEPQRIEAFAAGEMPLALAVAVDRSFSMAGEPLAAEKAGARALLDALRPSDQVMAVAIGSEIEVVAPLGNDRAAAAAAIEGLQSWGTTPLYDAVRAAIEKIAPAAGRRALVLLSDGNNRYSTLDAATLVDFARHRDVIVYPVAIGRTRPPVFVELASVTGGRSFLVRQPKDLPGVLETIARELRAQYLLGYQPPHADGEWHAIDVRVDRPKVTVRARDGYVAPAR